MSVTPYTNLCLECHVLYKRRRPGPARVCQPGALYTERTVVTAPGNDDRAAGEPVLRVIRGDATPEEIAALVAVLMSRPGGGEPPARETPSAWPDKSRLLRRPLQPGPG